MNNKGFTLVELLSVMVILVSISLIAVGGISASLEKRDVRECVENKELAVGVAKIYFSLNTSSTSVTILQLKNGNYFSDNKILDGLSDSDVISRGSDTYTYEGVDIYDTAAIETSCS